MKALSLFAGVGGFDLAAERVGIDVVAHCEIDKAARSVLRRHFPKALSYDDVRTLDPDDLRAAGAVPDIILGGFPCQDLSVAGRRAGLAGARSGLFYDIARLAAVLRPRWLVLENVPGLLSSNAGRDMGAVLGTLGELGYGWAYRVLDAQHFGVPQRRRRVFIVGCLGDWAAPVEVLLEPESSDRHPAAGVAAGQELAGTLGDGSGSRGWAPDTDRMTFLPVVATLTGGTATKPGVNAPDRRQEDDVNLVATTLTARECKGPDSDATTTLIAHTLTGEGFDASEDGTGRGTPLVPIAFGHQAGIDPQPSEFVTPILQAFKSGAGVSTGLAVRRLTPTECERLQGFPDGWTAGQADSARYRQMGNAVAVPVVEWILRQVVAVDAKAVAA